MNILVILAACTGGSDATSEPGGGAPADPCGDGVCASGENLASCRRDCPPAIEFDGSIDACVVGIEQPDIDSSLVVIGTTADSYHEMVACGGLAMTLASQLVLVVAAAVADAAGVRIPDDFVYAGDGQYVTGAGGTTMIVEFLLGGDYELGPEDTVVAYDLFDWGNYLVGASVSVDAVAQEVVIAYDAAGPLVELLGFGADPPNPLVVDLADAYTIGAPIPRLKMRASVDVVDAQGGGTVTYSLASDPRRLSPLLEEGGFDYTMIAANTLGPSADELTSTSWDVGYNDQAGALNGTVDFEVRGGVVPLDGTFTYVESTYPIVTLSCP